MLVWEMCGFHMQYIDCDYVCMSQSGGEGGERKRRIKGKKKEEEG